MKQTKFRGTRRIAAVAVVAGLLTASTANATTYTTTGKSTADDQVSFEIDVDAKAKKGKLKSAKEITRLTMDNAEFECSATGVSGRADYFHMGLIDDPVEIAKNGKFNDVWEFEARGHVIERYTLKGKVTGKGKSVVIKGSFKAERSEGGLEFNNCQTDAVPFQVKAKL